MSSPSPSPPPPDGRVPATAAARHRQRLRRRLSLREWRRLPAPLLVALALHAAVGVYYMNQYVFGVVEEPYLVAQVSSENLAQAIEPEPPPEPVVMEEPEEQVEDPLVDLTDDPSSDADELVDLLGLGSSGLGGGGRAGLSSVRGHEQDDPSLGLGANPFRRFVEDLRGRGLDVAIVVDATGSMQRFIDRARQALDGIVADISAVVPDARLAVVAYRDLADDWVSRHTDLTGNHYVVHNFLYDLEAAGGMRQSADFEEAIEVGLAVATEQLSWRPESRRVIILVGDAPYHDDDRQTVLSLVRGFARGDHALINAVQVGAPDDGHPTQGALRTREAFGRIADTGNGHLFELVLDPDRPRSGASEGPEAEALRRRVLEATFGPEWSQQVEGLLGGRRLDPKQASAARREAASDRRWFAAKLLQGRLHPAVIDGARRLFDGRIAVACLTVLNDAQADADLRAAVLNILKTQLDGVRGLPFDVDAPLSEQTQVLALIRREVLGLPGAAAYAEAAARGVLDEVPDGARAGRPERARRPGAPPPPPPPVGG